MRFLTTTCMFYLALAFGALCASTDAYGQQANGHPRPKFEDYRVEVMNNEHKSPLIMPAQSEVYEEFSERYDLNSVNYAGKYVVIQISCGVSCVAVAAVNAQTGKMVEMSTVYCDLEPSCRKYPKVEFRRDSSLIILTGILNVDEENATKNICRYYYIIEDDSMRLIDSEFLEAIK